MRLIWASLGHLVDHTMSQKGEMRSRTHLGLGLGLAQGSGIPFPIELLPKPVLSIQVWGDLCGKFPGALLVPGVNTANTKYYLLFPVGPQVATCAPTHVFLSLFLLYFVLFAENVSLSLTGEPNQDCE